MAMQRRHQVFINHGGNDLNTANFVKHLARALKLEGFYVFIASDEERSRSNIEYIFEEIEKSTVALVIFSERYASSEMCLNEAVKIYDQRRENKLVLFPVFYKVSTYDVNMFNGKFGECFLETLKIRCIRNHPFAEHWMTNVNLICTETGFTTDKYDEILMVAILQAVDRRLLRKDLTNKNDVLVEEDQPKFLEGFGRELLYASSVALLCYFLVIPFLFTDFDLFSIRHWLVSVLIWFVVRKCFR
ncbi:unnamed protein product [Cochlearia groenlandica]